MKVILLKDVPKLGKKFEVKDVSDGYGRNFLIKNKLAEMATKDSIKKAEENKNRLEEFKKAEEASTIKKLESLGDVEIESKANEEGQLFAGIKKAEILEELEKRDIKIEEDDLVLEKPIKSIGEHDIDILLGGKKHKVKIKIKKLN